MDKTATLNLRVNPLSKAPNSINVDQMNDEELQAKIKKAYADIEAGNIQDVSKFRENH